MKRSVVEAGVVVWASEKTDGGWEQVSASWMGLTAMVCDRRTPSGLMRPDVRVFITATGRTVFHSTRDGIDAAGLEAGKRLAALVMCAMVAAAGGVVMDAEVGAEAA